MHFIVLFVVVTLPICARADRCVTHVKCQESSQGNEKYFCEARGRKCCIASDGRLVMTDTNHQCCQNAIAPAYNASHSLCNGTNVISKLGNLEQCGHNQVYLKGKQECKKGARSSYIVADASSQPTNPSSPSSRISESADPMLDIDCIDDDINCCAGHLLTLNELCDKGNVIKKEAFDHDSAFSGRTYNSQTHAVANRTIYPFPPGKNEICGNAHFYSISSDLCCNGAFHEGAKRDSSCCGVNIYKKEGEVCCLGKTYQLEKGAECYRNRYAKSIKVDPIYEPFHSFFFESKPNNSKQLNSNKRDCKVTGMLVIPNNNPKRYGYRAKIDSFTIKFPHAKSCRKIKRKTLYVIVTAQTVKTGDTLLKLSKKSKYFIKRISGRIAIQLRESMQQVS